MSPDTHPGQEHADTAKRVHSTVMAVVGTRPECIKLAPFVHAFFQRYGRRPVLVNSGQHTEAVRCTLEEFDLHADATLPSLPFVPNLCTGVRQLQRQVQHAIRRYRPRWVLVQGDTATAYAAARAGSAAGCCVAHVEAGLRTPHAADPFPEEWFRRRIASHAGIHFAPTRAAQLNLLSEGFSATRLHVVGNTGIDSLRSVLDTFPEQRRAVRRAERVIVTLHRRENWDANAVVICDALLALSARRPELSFLLPVHPNPRIAPRLRRKLEGHSRFLLVAPMGYREFIAAAAGAALIVSDSGGIQEEAPHLGVPLLVPRSCTERPEAIATGFVRLVAIDREAIVREALDLLDARHLTPLPFDGSAPFGDGEASYRIVDVLHALAVEALAA